MSNPPWTRKAFILPLQLLLWLSVISAGFQASENQSFAQATNFAIGTTVQQAGVKRLGINLGGQNYYDSGQMLRDLTFRNPGFEAETWQSVLDCVAVTATSCTDGNPWNVWPQNFLAGATFQVINGTASGETGTIQSFSPSDYAATGSNDPTYGATITFPALSTPLVAGDYVIVHMQVPGNPGAGWWTYTGGGGTLLADTTDLASDTPGKQAIELKAPSSGQSASVVENFDSTAGRSFVQLNGSYTVVFKAKGLGGNNQLNVSVNRLGGATYLNQNVTLTSSWQDYSYTFNASEDGSALGTVQMTFAVNGADIYLDDASLTEAAAPDNPTAFRNAVVDRLRSLNPGVIRYMDGTDFGTSIANAVAVPFARQRAGFNSQSTESDDDPMGLEEFLVLCQAVGAEPWYTMAGTASTTDMQNLIEFLGGSSSTPYGAIRAALGQSAPWTSVFPVIHIELGNEMWNSGMPGEAITDPVVYANRATTIFAAAKASSSYNASSFDLIMGSWAADPWYTQQEISNGSNYDSVDAAPYLYYTFSDYSSNEAIFGPMFTEPEYTDSTSNGYMYQQAQAAAAANPPTKLAVYETNLSTISGTAPQSDVTSVVGSVGAGITIADHMLLMMRDLGITTQNMFALTEYENGFSNTATGAGETTPLWGATIDMGGETNLNRPQFIAEQLANTAIMPTMLAVTVTGSNPTWNQAASANGSPDPQVSNVHYLQSFAFTDGTHYSVVLFNLSRSGSLPVTFSGANAPTGNVLVSQLTSGQITDNNESNSSVVNTTQTDVSNFQPATAYSLPPFSMTVFSWPGTTLPPSTTVLTASPTQGATGQTITLTATVTSQSGTTTPTGAVTFLNGSTTLGTSTLSSTGIATFTTNSLPAGADSLTASYGGDTSDANSVSSPVVVNLTSNTVATTTALTASATKINTGQSVTFTATVAPTSGSIVPSGTITFLNGSTSLGSATLSASGVVSLTTSALPAGTDSITASYGGSPTNTSSISPAVPVSVTQTVVSTTTALIASATQITPGQGVVFTANVTPASGSVVPTGTITFFNGATPLGTATLSSTGSASFQTSGLAAGTHAITASYGGDAGDTASVSAAVTVTVSQGMVSTTTSVIASPTSIQTGQNVTFTATAAASSGTAVPGGQIAFLNGNTIIGTATLNAKGVASFSTTALPAGTDSITASYGGNTGFGSSVSAGITVTVTQTVASTTTAIEASATQITSGQNVTFTAAVTSQSGSTTPTGTVTFLDGSTALGTATLSRHGNASFSTANLAAGTQSITASYGGSSGDSASVSSPITITVSTTAAKTVTSLSASASQIKSGQNVTFTATVKPESGSTVPAGSVSFLNGSTIIGTGTLNSSGVAFFSTSSLRVGSDSITASYAGDSTDLSSVSTVPVVVVVTQSVVATGTSLSASATQIQNGDNVVLTAVVTPQSGTTTPSGTVTFKDGNAAIGTATLNASGTAFLSQSTLAVGTHSITAVYAGNTGNSGSTSNAISIVVSQSITATTTMLSVSASQITLSQGTVFTAVVKAQSGNTAPTGTVAFLDGSSIIATAVLNANGGASFSTTALSLGTHIITASYEGSSSDSSSVSTPVTISVVPAPGDTQTTIATRALLSVSPSTAASGQLITLTVTVSPQSGKGVPAGTVTFYDGSSYLGAAALSNGAAALKTTSLPVGNNTITAAYSGDSSYTDSISQGITVVITTAESPSTQSATTTILTEASSQVNSGQSASFNATVKRQSGSGTPTGTVTFYDGQSALGKITLNGTGTASFSTSSLAVGAQSITASYSGDSADIASTSAAVTETVVSAATPSYTMSVSSSDVSLTPGQVANLTVTLTPVNGFNMPVTLACSGLPAGTSCNFSPPSVTPDGKPVSSTLSILVNDTSSTAENRPPAESSKGRLAFGLVMPWGLLSLLGLRRRENRSRMIAWSARVAITVALIAGSLWMSGCGYSLNGSVFTMTVTSSGKNIPTQTSQITVNINQ